MTAEPNIKNRVTGAIVLVALAVIFLPLILDGQKKNQILESQIPDKPIKGKIILLNVDDIAATSAKQKEKKKQSTTEQELPDNSSKTTVEKTKDQLSNKNTSDPVKKVVAKIEPEIKTVVKKQTETTLPEVIVSQPTEVRRDRPNYKSAAYVIQLGSFGNKINANKLVLKLKKTGYKAYLSDGKSNGNIIHRVLVGPILKRSHAESKITSLMKLSGLKPIILAYDPLKH